MTFHLPTRRRFLGSTLSAGAALVLPGVSAGQTILPPKSPRKVAALVTTYHRYSHADNIVTRFMEGYAVLGKGYPPPCQVASLYIEQVNDQDIGRPIANRWKVPLYDTMAEALTLGGDQLAVDGVLIVAEHGDYPLNERGQKLYPRRRFFEEVIKVFRDSQRVAPVFNDKHLAYNWGDAKWIYDQSRELGFPLMAGSSIPVTHRHPDLRPKRDTPWESALSVGHGHFESYGFHTLEGLQVMTERRPGGETGVKAVQCLQGQAAWDAASKGLWDRRLLDAALSKCPIRGQKAVEEDDRDALVYLIEYRDGFRAAAYLSPRHFGEFAFAGRVRGQKEPLACWYELPKPQRDHFSLLVHHVAAMMVTGKATYPVERTLLTGGMLDFLIHSKTSGYQRIETPQLQVRYQAVE
ncbi:MAG: hypothetical protein ACK4RK_14460 [Gemmataceae bacterium]